MSMQNLVSNRWKEISFGFIEGGGWEGLFLLQRNTERKAEQVTHKRETKSQPGREIHIACYLTTATSAVFVIIMNSAP